MLDLEEFRIRCWKFAQRNYSVLNGRSYSYPLRNQPIPQIIRTNEKLSEWIRDPDAHYCWMKIVLGGDPNKVEDRRIFIEKTPRVFDPSFGVPITECYGWVEGIKGECGYDEPDEDSAKWANEFAQYLGYIL